MLDLAITAWNLQHCHAGYDVHMYGGDIILTPEQQSLLEATANEKDPFSPQNAVVRNEQLLWPNATIHYILDDTLSMFTAQLCDVMTIPHLL